MWNERLAVHKSHWGLSSSNTSFREGGKEKLQDEVLCTMSYRCSVVMYFSAAPYWLEVCYQVQYPKPNGFNWGRLLSVLERLTAIFFFSNSEMTALSSLTFPSICKRQVQNKTMYKSLHVSKWTEKEPDSITSSHLFFSLTFSCLMFSSSTPAFFCTSWDNNSWSN